jgi:hypothetical protein
MKVEFPHLQIQGLEKSESTILPGQQCPGPFRRANSAANLLVPDD